QAVAEFLAGARSPADSGRDVVVVQPPSAKEIQVDVVVPVPDLADLRSAPAASAPAASAGAEGSPDPGPAEVDARPARTASVWPHVEERVVDLVSAHR